MEIGHVLLQDPLPLLRDTLQHQVPPVILRVNGNTHHTTDVQVYTLSTVGGNDEKPATYFQHFDNLPVVLIRLPHQLVRPGHRRQRHAVLVVSDVNNTHLCVMTLVSLRKLRNSFLDMTILSLRCLSYSASRLYTRHTKKHSGIRRIHGRETHRRVAPNGFTGYRTVEGLRAAS